MAGVRGDEPLRVLMPRGLASLAKESGIGAAIRHQETAVRALGHEVVTNPLRPFDVVHLNTPFQDTPLLALSLWEHAWYLDYRDNRRKYLDAFWQLVNWEAVAARLR